MNSEVFRVRYAGGFWWVEVSRNGTWVVCRGPYKHRVGAEQRIERERKSPEEVK